MLKRMWAALVVVSAVLAIGTVWADEGAAKDAGSSKPAHKKAEDHAGHKHGKNCGHKSEKHGDHVDYEHDGHHHKKDGKHYDECDGPETDAKTTESK